MRAASMISKRSCGSCSAFGLIASRMFDVPDGFQAHPSSTPSHACSQIALTTSRIEYARLRSDTHRLKRFVSGCADLRKTVLRRVSWPLPAKKSFPIFCRELSRAGPRCDSCCVCATSTHSLGSVDGTTPHDFPRISQPINSLVTTDPLGPGSHPLTSIDVHRGRSGLRYFTLHPRTSRWQAAIPSWGSIWGYGQPMN